jgi:hypothetical protein
LIKGFCLALLARDALWRKNVETAINFFEALKKKSSHGQYIKERKAWSSRIKGANTYHLTSHS